jgi:DNA polymerase elongation subunit (family B)
LCLIDLRSETKARLSNASGAEAARLKSEEQALKIIANSASYGIFVEVNVCDLDEREQRQCFGPKGEPFAISTDKNEEPGRYFHPLLASLITGAARLMLAITETLAIQAGIDWVFCDTDSMALAKPEGMDRDVFFEVAQSICDWFSPLNPYERKSRLLKIEDVNLGLDQRDSTSGLADLFCLAISAKRYVLFNLGADGVPII